MQFRMVCLLACNTSTGSSVPEMSGFRKSRFPKVRTGVFVSLSTRRSAGAVGSRQADRNIFRACADSKYISLLTVPVQVVRRNADSGGTELASIRATCSGDIKPDHNIADRMGSQGSRSESESRTKNCYSITVIPKLGSPN